MEKKLGSLFNGIGGFPLAAKRNGIRPVWASEIEKFPMAVTMYRFPEMKHMGDITKLHGENLPVVDVIAGGSPCQDLSIAGRRAGLAGIIWRPLWPFYGTGQAGKGDAKCRQITRPNSSRCSAKIYGMGKCAGSLLKRRTKRSRF